MQRLGGLLWRGQKKRLSRELRNLGKASLSTTGTELATLPDLPYDYDALEPIISKDIMFLHHTKHHAAYVQHYNTAVKEFTLAASSHDDDKMQQVLANIKFNGGGHLNHSIFWKNLCPVGEGGEPEGQLLQMITRDFGSLESMKTRFNSSTVGIKGSGWGWLVYDPTSVSLRIMTMANQDPVASTGMIPLLGLDVWEHAYYLQYYNRRNTYLEQIWQVVNWNDVQKRFMDASMK